MSPRGDFAMGEVMKALLTNFFSLGEEGIMTREFESSLSMKSDYVKKFQGIFY